MKNAGGRAHLGKKRREDNAYGAGTHHKGSHEISKDTLYDRGIRVDDMTKKYSSKMYS